MYSSLYSLLWQCVLAYEAGRLMVCWNGSKIWKNIQPTTLAALAWLGGALDNKIFQVKSRISEAFFILLLLISLLFRINEFVASSIHLDWQKYVENHQEVSYLHLYWPCTAFWIHKVGQVLSFRQLESMYYFNKT